MRRLMVLMVALAATGLILDAPARAGGITGDLKIFVAQNCNPDIVTRPGDPVGAIKITITPSLITAVPTTPVSEGTRPRNVWMARRPTSSTMSGCTISNWASSHGRQRACSSGVGTRSPRGSTSRKGTPSKVFCDQSSNTRRSAGEFLS